MRKRNLFLTIFGLILILLSGCTSVLSAQQTPTPGATRTPQTQAQQAVTLVKPAGSVPATCTPTPVYVGSHNGGMALRPEKRL